VFPELKSTAFMVDLRWKVSGKRRSAGQSSRHRPTIARGTRTSDGEVQSITLLGCHWIMRRLLLRPRR